MGLQPLPACDMSRRSNRSGLSRVPAAAISDRLDFILKRKDTLFLKVHFVDLGESFSNVDVLTKRLGFDTVTCRYSPSRSLSRYSPSRFCPSRISSVCHSVCCAACICSCQLCHTKLRNTEKCEANTYIFLWPRLKGPEKLPILR